MVCKTKRAGLVRTLLNLDGLRVFTLLTLARIRRVAGFGKLGLRVHLEFVDRVEHGLMVGVIFFKTF